MELILKDQHLSLLLNCSSRLDFHVKSESAGQTPQRDKYLSFELSCYYHQWTKIRSVEVIWLTPLPPTEVQGSVNKPKIFSV